jgi:hypothetical protein
MPSELEGKQASGARVGVGLGVVLAAGVPVVVIAGVVVTVRLGIGVGVAVGLGVKVGTVVGTSRAVQAGHGSQPASPNIAHSPSTIGAASAIKADFIP